MAKLTDAESAAPVTLGFLEQVLEPLVESTVKHIHDSNTALRTELAAQREMIRTLQLRADRQKNHLDALETKFAKLMVSK